MVHKTHLKKEGGWYGEEQELKRIEEWMKERERRRVKEMGNRKKPYMGMVKGGKWTEREEWKRKG